MEFERIADIKRLNFIIDALKKQLPSGAQVLDVGCGNGVISRALGEQGFNVRGIDVSEKAIARARELNKRPQNVVFDNISAEQLVADGHRYHAVICSEVLEHLNEPEKLLKVLYQTLEDKGILIVTVPNGNGPRELLVTRPVIALQQKDNWMWKLVKRIKVLFGYKGTTVQSSADNLTHIQFFTKKSLEQLATGAQFRIVRFERTNFIEDVFPFSFLTKRMKVLQKLDCAIAEKLPYSMTGGFVTVWEKARMVKQ
jgi:2-polyprenyl-3-methyl-5-hydroxy-6-metoxy-1,4-benzoquinol methylase